jgi:hypothetical protein
MGNLIDILESLGDAKRATGNFNDALDFYKVR